MEKIEVVLTDGTSLEGIPIGKRMDRLNGRLERLAFDPDSEQDLGTGLLLENVHRSRQEGSVPIAKRVFVPYSNILFIVLEQ